MDTLHLLGSAMGLGLLAGIRLYATVFGIGLAIHFGWFEPSPAMDQLRLLSDWRVLAVSGSACLVEFFADKVPWLDSMWDAAHTVIRPIGAALLGITALGQADPAMTTAIAILTGGVAFTGHSTKAATRVAANHSPEPFSNFFLSLADDIFAPLGLWLVLSHPVIAFVLVLLFLIVFVWIARTIWRLFRRGMERRQAPVTQ